MTTTESQAGARTTGSPSRIPSRGYAAASAKTPLAAFAFERRAPGPKDVHIEILFCGVCHSDLHQVKDEWGGSTFPMVPGHEIIGRVKQVGARVTKFKVGDIAGVGCMVDSCRTCPDCRVGLEQFCQGTLTFTYNSPDPI
ncbi:MAG: alcohol dehydrogenase catalytic domain-containing protein, partial [Gemmatimonadota bacterium]